MRQLLITSVFAFSSAASAHELADVPQGFIHELIHAAPAIAIITVALLVAIRKFTSK